VDGILRPDHNLSVQVRVWHDQYALGAKWWVVALQSFLASVPAFEWFDAVVPRSEQVKLLSSVWNAQTKDFVQVT
jgi:hypothetical protein